MLQWMRRRDADTSISGGKHQNKTGAVGGEDGNAMEFRTVYGWDCLRN